MGDIVAVVGGQGIGRAIERGFLGEREYFGKRGGAFINYICFHFSKTLGCTFRGMFLDI